MDGGTEKRRGERGKHQPIPEEKMLQEAFSGRVRERMEALGQSLNFTADFAGINRGHLSQVLRGKQSPTLNTVARLAVALKCQPHELLMGGG